MNRRIIFIFVLLLSYSSPVFADSVTLFSFVTDPQTVALNILSGDITVQSQSSSGASSSIGETFDLAFTSTSATGQFLNSSGNAVSTTMSKNTSNRTFYYKDSLSGDFVLTVSATGRDTHRTFSTTQHIVVGSPSNASTATTTSKTSSSGTSSTPSPITQIVIVYSAHSDPAPLGDPTTPVSFEVSAGRDRLAVVGNSIVFRAAPIKVQNVSQNNIRYQWSFGDGTTAQSDTVSHAYRFAGDYAVVLNATYSDVSAVSRTNVKVVNPSLGIARIKGGLEVSNNSNWEINLEGWSLESGAMSFVFPRDTLIPAGRKIIFPDDVTKINSSSVVLFNPLHTKYAFLDAEPKPNVTNSPISTTSPQDLRRQIDILQQALNQMPKERPTEMVPFVVKKPLVSEVPSTSSQTANVSEIFVAPARVGLMSQVFALPISWVKFTRHLFVED